MALAPGASLCVGQVPPPSPAPLSPGCGACAWRAPGHGRCCERCWRCLHPPGPSRDDEAREPRSLERVRGQPVLGWGPKHCCLVTSWASLFWPLTDRTLPTRCDPTPSGSRPAGSAVSAHAGHVVMFAVCKISDGLGCPPSCRLPVKRSIPLLCSERKLALALRPLAPDFTPSENRSWSSQPTQTSLK